MAPVESDAVLLHAMADGKVCAWYFFNGTKLCMEIHNKLIEPYRFLQRAVTAVKFQHVFNNLINALCVVFNNL